MVNDPREQFRAAMLAALGAAPEDIEPGRLQRFSTNGKRSDLSGWSHWFDERGGVYGCWRQNISETWTARPQDQMTPSERAALRAQIAKAKAEREAEQRQQWRKNRDRIEYMRRQARPVTDGDPVSLYLCRRMALQRFDAPACLRYAPDMAYVHEGETIGSYPVMLAPLVDRSGELLTWHRTYLSDDGQKADVPGPAKKLMPAAGLLRGTCIPLAGPRDGVLGISEGVESALAASLAHGVPTVAAYSAGNLAAWKWPAVHRIVIYGDADDAGRKAADELRARVMAAGLKCSLSFPETEGTDWCDAWIARTAATGENQ